VWPAYDVEIIDTLPTNYLEVDYGTIMLESGWTYSVAPAVLPGGGKALTAVVTLTKTNGLPMMPGDAAEFTVDATVNTQVAIGDVVVSNTAYATSVNPCDPGGPLLAVDPAANPGQWTSFILTPRITMLVKIYNAAGELVRSYNPMPVGLTPTDFRFTYSASGQAGCTAPTLWAPDPLAPTIWVTGDPTQPFSPDCDGVNDIVLFTFDELQVRDELGNLIPYRGDWMTGEMAWDGRNDQGVLVANGQYMVVVESVDPQTGNPVVVSKMITMGAERTEVVARIFNAAGEEVVVLPTDGLRAGVASIRIEPNPYAPVLNPVVGTGPGDSTGVVYIYLYADAAGTIPIDADPSTPATMDALKWYGRACPNAPHNVCDPNIPTMGVIVSNGVYLVQLTSVTPEGEQTTIT